LYENIDLINHGTVRDPGVLYCRLSQKTIKEFIVVDREKYRVVATG